MFRQLAKGASVMRSMLDARVRSDILFLMYHRVSGKLRFELDVEPRDFEAQMRWLAQHCDVVSIDHAVERLDGRRAASQVMRPQVVLTFDDAYLDFFLFVYPLLKQFGFPAIVYVPTQFINDPRCVPISRELNDRDAVLPVSWEMLRVLSKDPLITVGAHSHTHREFPTLDDYSVIEEIDVAERHFAEQLGFVPRHFAYPRGRWDVRCETLIANRFETIALVGGGGVSSNNFCAKRITRIPVLRGDGRFWFPHRVAERLGYEERIAVWVKRMLGR